MPAPTVRHPVVIRFKETEAPYQLAVVGLSGRGRVFFGTAATGRPVSLWKQSSARSMPRPDTMIPNLLLVHLRGRLPERNEEIRSQDHQGRGAKQPVKQLQAGVRQDLAFYSWPKGILIVVSGRCRGWLTGTGWQSHRLRLRPRRASRRSPRLGARPYSGRLGSRTVSGGPGRALPAGSFAGSNGQPRAGRQRRIEPQQ